MTNKLFSRNLFKISLLFLGITFLLVEHSCKKDRSMQSDVELIHQAKIWFQSQSSVAYNPSWDSATVIHLNNQNFIILPSNVSFSGSGVDLDTYLVDNISVKETKGNLVELFNTSNLNV